MMEETTHPVGGLKLGGLLRRNLIDPSCIFRQINAKPCPH